MKLTFLVGAFFAATAGLLWGQSFTVVIQNADEESFHYVLDPPELTAFETATSIFENVVFDYFVQAPVEGEEFTGFNDLAPGESVVLEQLAEGKHLLVGFFVIPGQMGFPVRVITLQAGGGLDERTYRIYSEPALITARAGRGRISEYAPIPPQPVARAVESAEAGARPVESAVATASEGTEAGARPAESDAPASPRVAASPPTAAPAAPAPAASTEQRGFFRFRIDNQYEDWEAIPTFLSFPADRSLPSFTREQYGGEFEVLPIDKSRHWGSQGTSINEIKVVNNLDAVYVYISTHTALSPNVSVFLYFHTEQNLRRTGATNRFTLELLPAKAEEPGLVILWEKERKPMIVGTLASGSFFMEARIDKDLLYDIQTAKPEVTFFDLTTSCYDRQELAYEEFYIASIPLAGIPTEQTLY